MLLFYFSDHVLLFCFSDHVLLFCFSDHVIFLSFWYYNTKVNSTMSITRAHTDRLQLDKVSSDCQGL